MTIPVEWNDDDIFICATIKDANALLASHKALVSALGNYMSQFGQALDAHGISYGPAQQAADIEARSALAQAEKVVK